MPVFCANTAGRASTTTRTSAGFLEERPSRTDRPDPVADGQGVPDGLGDERLSLSDRFLERLAPSEVGGDGGGEHAPGAMGMGGLDPLTPDPLEPAAAGKDVVGTVTDVSSLDQHRP